MIARTQLSVENQTESHSGQKLFNKAVVFSGGGLRFGYYLGVYQALCDNQQKPDLILASCGGAFIAGLLELTENGLQAFKLLQSQACYDMLCRITPKPPIKTPDYALAAIKRWLITQGNQIAQKQPRIPLSLFESSLTSKTANQIVTTLTQQSIAYIANETDSNPLWPFTADQDVAKTNGFNSIIIASRLAPAVQGNQWQVVLRCNHPSLAQQLKLLNPPNVLAKYQPQLIHPAHHIANDMPLNIAVRASISDMYYLPPLLWQDNILMGGLLNLTPIELACQLASTVYVETKAEYDKWMAEPAIHSVFGFMANNRLKEVHAYDDNSTQLHWIDTANNAEHICPAISKKLRLRQGYIDVVRPDIASYQTLMQEQYTYGYQRTIEALREQS